jgi:hypothetical protein
LPLTPRAWGGGQLLGSLSAWVAQLVTIAPLRLAGQDCQVPHHVIPELGHEDIPRAQRVKPRGDVLVVGLAGLEAVVETADEPVEQVALGGDVTVAGGSAAVVVSSGPGSGDQGGEGPEVAGGGEALDLNPSVHHREGLAAGAGHENGAGVGLQRPCVAKARSVVTDPDKALRRLRGSSQLRGNKTTIGRRWSGLSW